MPSVFKAESMSSTDRLPIYGGQALIEGVMMRGSKACAIAVRSPDDQIVLETRELGALYRSKLTKTPFVRGLFILWDALVLGMQALTFSANVQVEEPEERIEGASLTLSMLLGLALGIGLFFLLPAGVAFLFERYLNFPNWTTNLLEGLIRLGFLIGYIWAIGFIPEIRRVFGYHGAEHKTINAFEAGAELTPETVQTYSREHPRCGTAFLLTLVVFSIILFSLIGPLSLWMRFATRILLIPVLAMLAYEYIRLSASLLGYSWAKPFIAPNLWLQRLTTREPELPMLEVAIRAFEAMRAQETA
jgi:uncharacterized protein YqhQ